MVIRDAIHGGIEVNDLEEKIIDHPLFQRLRYVRQLSLVHLIYPSAVHTRFEHSLGSMHLSGKLAQRLGLKTEEVMGIKVAALLHDVGHGAFSHTSDSLLIRQTGMTHEERGLKLAKKTSLKDVLQDHGVRLKDLEAIFEGKQGGALIASELGCDRMDYLLRDAYFTGVSYSLVDHQRLLETLTLQNDELIVLEKGVVAAESLLVSRHLMFNAVYLHPTVRICEAMVERMLSDALENGLLTLDDIAQGTDDALLASLAAKSAWAGRLLERRLFKKAFVLEMAKAPAETRKFLAQQNAQLDLEEELSASLSDEFVVCLPPERKKHFGIHVLSKDGEPRPLEDYSNLLKALNFESGRDALIVACAEENKEKAVEITQKYLGLETRE